MLDSGTCWGRSAPQPRRRSGLGSAVAGQGLKASAAQGTGVRTLPEEHAPQSAMTSCRLDFPRPQQDPREFQL